MRHIRKALALLRDILIVSLLATLIVASVRLNVAIDRLTVAIEQMQGDVEATSIRARGALDTAQSAVSDIAESTLVALNSANTCMNTVEGVVAPEKPTFVQRLLGIRKKPAQEKK